MKQFSSVIGNLNKGSSSTTFTAPFDTGGRVSHFILAFNANSGYSHYSPTDFSCKIEKHSMVFL